ncbi:MAG TPA: methyltransferase domain-containing protein [Candidatus Polarisedimenticolia bacterium]|jgi:SAM-dependent methyltransferase|nr:methyltransferase domain-containing protein [Candidatus Polarisedimenticolia bacterium]
MKSSALRVFVCPACKGSLDLRERTGRGGEVLEGDLDCRGCSAVYPVRRGVPRFVSAGGYAGSFAYQWRHFRSVQLDSLNGRDESSRSFLETTGWTAESLRGRRVLDAGVGAGRYAEVAAMAGAEVFGIDLTEAVDAAYDNIGERPAIHLAQADIFALPFCQGTFDRAYSIGVLHHTPDPRAAFACVAACVKPGGSMAVYLYPNPGPACYGSDLIRRVTTRLPLRVMRALSSVAVPLYYPYRLPWLGKVLQFVSPISMHPHWRARWLDTFDWYTPKYQWKHSHPEVYAWFRENGCADIEIAKEPIRMRGVRAGALAPAPSP